MPDTTEKKIGTDVFSSDTNVLLADSDNDKLTDGQEVSLWYDPMHAEPDYDRRKDNAEYNAGTSPYTYDLANVDYMFAGLSAVSLVPAAGDALKAAGKVLRR